jgi:hypothetical protein
MSAIVIAVQLDVAVEQVEPIVAEYYAERRNRMMARFKSTPKPKPAPTPRPLKREQRRQEQEQREADRAAKHAAKQAEAEAARAAVEARRKIVHDGLGCPTAEQIAIACETIQAGWTDHERYSRWLQAHTNDLDGISGVERPGVDLQMVRVRELSAA